MSHRNSQAFCSDLTAYKIFVGAALVDWNIYSRQEVVNSGGKVLFKLNNYKNDIAVILYSNVYNMLS